jgi:hypothetical protein
MGALATQSTALHMRYSAQQPPHIEQHGVLYATVMSSPSGITLLVYCTLSQNTAGLHTAIITATGTAILEAQYTAENITYSM